jgi:hypothetical protein
MVLTIAVIVFCLFAIPALLFWLLRPRKEVTPGAYHNQMDDAARASGGVDAGHP